MMMCVWMYAYHFHEQDVKGSDFTPNVREHLAAMVSISPARNYQKAITPEFLWCMSRGTSSNILNNDEDHAANLIIGAYFFAMQSCEFSSVPEVGRTVMIRLGGIRFFSLNFRLIPQDHPDNRNRKFIFWYFYIYLPKFGWSSLLYM